MYSNSTKDESYGFTTDDTWYDLDNFSLPNGCKEVIIYIQLASGHRLSMRAMKFEVDNLPNGGVLFYGGCFVSGSVNNIGAYLNKSAQGLKPLVFENGVNTTTSCKMKLYYRYR